MKITVYKYVQYNNNNWSFYSLENSEKFKCVEKKEIFFDEADIKFLSNITNFTDLDYFLTNKWCKEKEAEEKAYIQKMIKETINKVKGDNNV